MFGLHVTLYMCEVLGKYAHETGNLCIDMEHTEHYKYKVTFFLGTVRYTHRKNPHVTRVLFAHLLLESNKNPTTKWDAASGMPM